LDFTTGGSGVTSMTLLAGANVVPKSTGVHAPLKRHCLAGDGGWELYRLMGLGQLGAEKSGNRPNMFVPV